MDCKEQKRKFYNDALKQGWQSVASIPLDYQPDVSMEMKARWFKRFQRLMKPKFAAEPRLVNHFTLGADPEFVLFDPVQGTRLDGNQLGLRTGQGFGVDSNGRLIEIRPFPSRSALAVLASTMVTMKWLAVTHPQTLPYTWRAGAFVLRDGLGGHVHLGRKTDSREAEVRSLDKLSEMLTALGVYPKDECAARVRGDQFGQRYGQPGDIRPQAHGYEYRTFPSWLDSPWMAYLTLVLSKLVVHDPSVFGDIQQVEQFSEKVARARIINLLGKWQGLDDDAAIALHTLRRRGMPKWEGGDCKTRWGVRYPKEMAAVVVDSIPGNIKPSSDELKEVFCHLVNGQELMPTMPVAYWGSKLPPHYQEILRYQDTTRITGLGELLKELVVHDSMLITFGSNDGAFEMKISTQLSKELSADWKKQLNDLKITNVMEPTAGRNIRLSPGSRSTASAKKIRAALVSGLFPIWKAAEVRPESLENWTKTKKETPIEPKHKGKVLFRKE